MPLDPLGIDKAEGDLTEKTIPEINADVVQFLTLLGHTLNGLLSRLDGATITVTVKLAPTP